MLLLKETEQKRRFGNLFLRQWLGGIGLSYLPFMPPLGLVLLLFAIFWPSGRQLTNLQDKIIEILAAQDDVRVIGPLLDALPHDDLRLAVAEPLTRLLPRLKADDAVSLDSSRRAALHRILYHMSESCDYWRPKAQYVNFILAILKALEQVGYASSLDCVRRLTEKEPVGPTEIRIREAAQECLTSLQARLDRKYDHRTLLCAATTPAPDPGSLLRPAAGTQEADPQQLLRAGVSDK